jgi:hypothetical protein
MSTDQSSSTSSSAPDSFARLARLAAAFGGAAGGFRDHDVFESIGEALAATGEFADVVLGEVVDQGNYGADRIPMAVVTPVQWDESDESDPINLIRRVSYRLTLIVRDENPGSRFDSLDRLSSVVQNALDGSALNGGCLPALSKLRQGRYDQGPGHPEQRLTLLGEFSYIVGGFQDHVS